MTRESALTASSTAVSTLPPLHQTSSQALARLHSGNSGFIIHRVGQVRYGFLSEAREFSWALRDYLNRALGEYVTTLTYEELFGTQDQLHWLIHLKSPNDYGRILRLVDHDQAFREVAETDRLPSRGGGSWERLFTESSFKETVIVPQHGLDQLMNKEGLNPDSEELPDGLFVSPAQYQTSVAADQLLHSANAGVIIHRKGQIKYEFRREGRAFAFEWQDYLNRSMPGKVTILLYEEGWGSQDRIHWLIHLKDLDQYKEIRKRETQDADCRAIFTKERVPAHKGGGTWGKMFVEGTLQETVLVPSSPKPSLD